MDRMTPLLEEADAAGLAIAIDGDKLVVRGPRGAELIARELLANKVEVMAVLAASPVADWRELFEERAALRQCQARYPRGVAERLAFGNVVEAWCRCHRQHHVPDTCAGCGQPLEGDALDLPDGARVHWERDREFACLIAAGGHRRSRASKALVEMGLEPPPGWKP